MIRILMMMLFLDFRIVSLPPLPIQPWTKEMDCTADTPTSLQFSMDNTLEGSEDCLYIEISTPNIKPNKPLPVMFWMGCFFFCRNLDSRFDPMYINNEDVIFVRCGFRQGPFGFISINDCLAPGNSGLKDIVMALKWVKRNISAFGGDQNNVTIFGNGSGGPIAHYMILSPMASGLFHKAIISSASTLNNWSLEKNPVNQVFELAKLLGITSPCKMEVIEELRYMPADKIMEAFAILEKRVFEWEDNQMFGAPFKPCVEDEFEGQPAFLTKNPYAILKSGNFNKVPLIIGINNIEAAVIQYTHCDFYKDFQKYNENVGLLVPKSLTKDEKLSKTIGEKLLKFYLQGELSLTEDTRVQFLQLFSDYYFLYFVNMTVRLHSQYAPDHPIYYYVINYSGEWEVPKNFDFFNSVGHYCEAPFIFDLKIPTITSVKGSRDSIMTRNRMVRMWTNFAKFGNPTPTEDDPLLQITWDPVENKDKLNYLSIGSELTKGRNPFHDRMTFWDDLFKEFMFLRILVICNDLGLVK